MSTPLPIVFANLPVGLNPLNVFDQQFDAATNGAYMQDATLPATALVPSGATAGTYGDASHTGQFVVNAEGLMTSASSIAIAIAASQITNGTTGSGAVVLATSPTLVTPDLGTPSAINLANATNLPVALVTAALVTLPTTLPGSSGQLWWNGGVLSLS